MRFRFSNNSSALVTTTVTTTAATVILEAGGGAKFPVLSGGDVFRATLIDSSGAKEIVEATAVVGDTVTIVRAQEGTAAQTFSSGSRFECRLTAGMAENFLQRTGDVMNGNLDMAGHDILNPRFPAPVQFVHINAQLIRPIDTDPNTPYNPSLETSAIVIPTQSSGARPSYHGSSITNTTMFSGVVLDWFGDVNNVPSWFKLCDGTNGTPDLRGRYIKGWIPSFGPGGFGGHSTTRTDPAEAFGIGWGVAVDAGGAHAHSGSTANAALSAGNLPPINIGTPERVDLSPGSGTSAVQFQSAATYSGSASHSHQIFADGSHIHWVHQPEFFVLAKVMFV